MLVNTSAKSKCISEEDGDVEVGTSDESRVL